MDKERLFMVCVCVCVCVCPRVHMMLQDITSDCDNDVNGGHRFPLIGAAQSRTVDKIHLLHALDPSGHC